MNRISDDMKTWFYAILIILFSPVLILFMFGYLILECICAFRDSIDSRNGRIKLIPINQLSEGHIDLVAKKNIDIIPI